MRDLATIVADNAAASHGILPNERAIRRARLDRQLRESDTAADGLPTLARHARETHAAKTLARRITLLAPLVGLDPKVAAERAVLVAFVTLADANPSFFDSRS